ncbi:maleylpyruvate isomerase N-terminal domain-containing protein [Actinoplanes aureus]|uniref:Maleylpyruvate isomerase N-terminal domain-containing protein n=1 Tax=Actinoplanes aureus TaxID=2792083 RepID=A0A931FXF2_9ACTN|nr:maleylpyruvate isomerase N-terminal domain-containing protein [Actinoplanes aureus]MBG0562425.1 maleylpyruvate isomerase N-terminal domain-containing protein [Actinoplanes aureus]
MNADHVEAAKTAMLAALTPAAEADWGVAAGTLEWSCRETAAHIAHDLLAYATQLTARADDAYLPLDLTVRPEATPPQILQIAAASADLLGVALRAAGPDARAWHWGPTDPSGFAALGVNEILLHTYDIANGLHLAWQPPPPLCAAVLTRLFPNAPGGDPVHALLWCTGRISLPDRPRLTSWTLRAAVD